MAIFLSLFNSIYQNYLAERHFRIYHHKIYSLSTKHCSRAAISNRGQVLKNHHKIKLIAASVALMASFGAMAGLGGLNVQSHLGEPFLGTVTVTGEEAKTLINGGRASISNSNLRVSVRKSGGDKAVVNIRSTQPIQDPVLIFKIGVGSQSREYTAIIDPAGYNGKTDGSTRVQNNTVNRMEAAPADTSVDRQAARERINRAIRSDNAGSQVQNRRPAEQAKQRQQAKPKAQTEYGGIVYGKRHLVREGQTLTGIASRIRPQGLTLEQTVQALVNANPDVFINNNADRMLAGKVLSIPSRAEFEKYLGQQTPSVAPVPAQEPSQAPGASVTAPVPTPASEPAQMQASAPAVEPSVAPQTDETQASAPAAAASEAVPAESSAVEPAAPAATETPAQQEPADSDGNGLWRWLLLGGAALIALYLLSKLFGRRRQQAEPDMLAPVAEEDAAEDEEHISEFKSAAKTEQDFPSSAVTTAAAAVVGGAAAVTAATQKPAGELEMEDDFGDDIFFTEVEETPVEKQGDVDFDLNAIDTTQAAIISGAVTHDEETEKRRDADWDAIESTESVYEPEPENPYVSYSAVASPAFEDKAAEPFEADQPSEPESWNIEAEAEKAKAEAEEEKAWDFFAEDTQAEKAAEVEPAEENFAAEAASSVAAASAFVSADDETVEFEKAESDEAAPLEFVPAEAEQEPVIDAAFEPSPELNDEVVETVETEVAAEPELFHIQQSEPLSFQDAEDFNTEAAPVAESDEVIEWDAINVTDSAEGLARDSGFISESVV